MLALLISCKTQEEKPDDILSESKMVEVMVDVHIFEAVKEAGKIQIDSLPRIVAANYRQIFEKYGISEGQFRKAFDYYEHNPAKMDELMTKVIDELSRREGEMKGEEK